MGLVRSKEMQKSRLKTYEKRLKKDFKKYNSEIKELKQEEFACEEDARKAVQKWIKKTPAGVLYLQPTISRSIRNRFLWIQVMCLNCSTGAV